jgi:hypothetical protein
MIGDVVTLSISKSARVSNSNATNPQVLFGRRLGDIAMPHLQRLDPPMDRGKGAE